MQLREAFAKEYIAFYYRPQRRGSATVLSPG